MPMEILDFAITPELLYERSWTGPMLLTTKPTSMGVDYRRACHCNRRVCHHFMKGHGLVQCYFAGIALLNVI